MTQFFGVLYVFHFFFHPIFRITRSLTVSFFFVVFFLTIVLFPIWAKCAAIVRCAVSVCRYRSTILYLDKKKKTAQPKRIASFSLNAIRSGANMFSQSCLSEIENVKYPVWTFGHEKQNANYNLKLSQTKAHKNLFNIIITYKAIHLIFQQNSKTVKSIEWERTFAFAFALTNVNVHVDFSVRMNHLPKRVNWVWPWRIIFV